jgi:hypothetical protein
LFFNKDLSHISSYYRDLKDEVIILVASQIQMWLKNTKKWTPMEDELPSVSLRAEIPPIDSFPLDQSGLPIIDTAALLSTLTKILGEVCEAPSLLKHFRVIAFPVHADNSHSGIAHWTLGILVNTLWKTGCKKQISFKWTLFHMDSAHCNPNNIKNATRIAQYVTKTEFKSEIKVIDLPVPTQNGSSDCGLYPAHFLRTFLRDVDYFINYCSSVSSLKQP